MVVGPPDLADPGVLVFFTAVRFLNLLKLQQMTAITRTGFIVVIMLYFTYYNLFNFPALPVVEIVVISTLLMKKLRNREVK